VPFLRIEGGDGIVEVRDHADVRPQSPVAHPLDDLIQLDSGRSASFIPAVPAASSVTVIAFKLPPPCVDCLPTARAQA